MPTTGTRLGAYTIRAPLGAGGMGKVYLAEDPRLGREVAIKLLSPEYSRNTELLSRFHREARILACLNHPNIAGIYALEEIEGGGHFVVLERVEGETLAERLARGRMGVPEALGVCRQIADGLAAAHERGIVHRDVKPANVMITPHGQVKVLDFGLARRVPGIHAPASETEGPILTEVGVILGTPGYMSPEQALGQLADHRADMFSFGCVLYECLGGRRAFRGGTLLEVTTALLHDPPDWSALAPDTPPSVRAVLQRCMEKLPERRPASMAEVRDSLSVGAARSPAATPASRLASPVPHNLPPERTSFVGRATELEHCVALLQAHRLLNLTGPGGSGKTRLALRLAERVMADYPDGVWFADLAALEEPARLPHLVARVVGLRLDGDPAPMKSLAGHLSAARALLLLDNCEHLIAACAELADRLLGACPNIRILATSRERIGLSGEQVFPVPPLGLPEPGQPHDAQGIAAHEGVQLFLERARLVRPDFGITDRDAPHLAAICRALDGLPLAIELAAARVRLLSLEQIRVRLNAQLRFLTGSERSMGARHRTLRATIQWSYDLLTQEEREFLRALSVFSGGWPLEGAAAVCRLDELEALDFLTRLADKSLVVVDGSLQAGTRYRLLELVREYALERLQAAREETGARDRHLDFFLGLAEEAAPRMLTADESRWLPRLEAEHENLLAALRWCDHGPEGAEKGLRLVHGLYRLWLVHGHIDVARRELRSALARTGPHTTRSRAAALAAAGDFAHMEGNLAEARALLEESLALYRTLNDAQGTIWANTVLGAVARGREDYPAARRHYGEALALGREAGNERAVAGNLGNLGIVALMEGDLIGARTLMQESLEIARRLGQKGRIAIAEVNLGLPCLVQRDFAAAREHVSQALALAHELGHKLVGASALELAAMLSIEAAATGPAARLYGAAEALREAIRAPLPDDEVRLRDEYLARARDALGPERLAMEWRAGRALGFQEALLAAQECLAPEALAVTRLASPGVSGTAE